MPLFPGEKPLICVSGRTSMRAVYFEEFQAKPEVQTVPDPEPPARGVVIEVRATGLCRSDWHGWMGHDADVSLPHVPGHEFAGVVRAVGREVRGWKAGQRVTVPFVSGCGECEWCARGDQQICDRQFQPGFTHWGSFAEYVAVDYADVNLVALPEEIDDATAASLGCRFVTSFRAVIDQGRVRAGEFVAVHGCGGVGLSAIMIAVAAGAQVIAVDVTEEKLRFARELGAAMTVDGSREDVAAAILDITRGGAHLSIDALGSRATCFNSVACLRKRGRHVQVGLLAGGEKHPPLPMELVIARELEIVGSHGMQAHRYPAMLDMIRAGMLNPGLLVGERVGLDDVPERLARMNEFAGTGITIVERF